jgi:hypothetical protein
VHRVMRSGAGAPRGPPGRPGTEQPYCPSRASMYVEGCCSAAATYGTRRIDAFSAAPKRDNRGCTRDDNGCRVPRAVATASRVVRRPSSRNAAKRRETSRNEPHQPRRAQPYIYGAAAAPTRGTRQRPRRSTAGLQFRAVVSPRLRVITGRPSGNGYPGAGLVCLRGGFSLRIHRGFDPDVAPRLQSMHPSTPRPARSAADNRLPDAARSGIGLKRPFLLSSML